MLYANTRPCGEKFFLLCEFWLVWLARHARHIMKDKLPCEKVDEDIMIKLSLNILLFFLFIEAWLSGVPER